MMLLVSPAEPAKLRQLGRVSSLPEARGVDFLWRAQDMWWGLQRKELKDFIASVGDGRLAREIGMMRAGVVMPMVVIEGSITFTSDGKLIWNSWGQEWTREQWDSALLSLMHQGTHVSYSVSMRDTARVVKAYYGWSQKPRHTSMVTRPGPVVPWGKPDNRDYAEHLLMGIKDVGPELAKRVVAKFGRAPWRWEVTAEELEEIEGIGKVKAAAMIRALHGEATLHGKVVGT